MEPASDPTVAHAGLTEIDDGSATAMTNGNGHAQQDSPETSGIVNADVGDDAANAVAESQWDTGNSMTASQEWVEVPRDPAETETGLAATTAAPANTQSWADEPPEQAAAPVDPNDGFQSVQGRNHRGRGDRDAGYRGDRRGGYRGRGGFRGEGRGRGRGSNRGGMPYRGPRRTEES
jgi:hypothetical protein